MPSVTGLRGTATSSTPRRARLAERKKTLLKLLRRAWRGIEIREHPEGDGAVIFEHACKLGLEGIVCKQLDLPYRAGLSKSWIKVKNKKHPPCCG